MRKIFSSIGLLLLLSAGTLSLTGCGTDPPEFPAYLAGMSLKSFTPRPDGQTLFSFKTDIAFSQKYNDDPESQDIFQNVWVSFLCDPKILETSMERGRLNREGAVSLGTTSAGSLSGSAPGISQVVSENPLKAGESITITGHIPAAAKISLSVQESSGKSRRLNVPAKLLKYGSNRLTVLSKDQQYSVAIKTTKERSAE